MSLPFTRDQFFEVFGRYNDAVWPMPWILTALAMFAVVAALSPARHRHRIIVAVLALLWAWMAVAYHWLFFSEINPVARLFAGIFIGHAILLAWLGVAGSKLRFRWPGGVRGGTGAVLMLFALVIYPLLSHMLGHRFPETPTFGLPCPTTIFTLGMFLWLDQPVPRFIFVVPLIWTIIGGSAAFLLGVPQDLGLLAAGLISVPRTVSRLVR